MHDVARSISEVAGRTVPYLDQSASERRAVLQSAGVPPLIVEVALGLDDMTLAGIFAAPSPVVEAVTGVPARSIRSLIREQASNFAPVVSQTRVA